MTLVSVLVAIAILAGQHQRLAAGDLIPPDGWATYYDDGPGLYAAVHSYRWGHPRYRARVCLAADPDRCVTVTVRDHCQCYWGTSDERLVDLSPQAFSRLGSLSRGKLRVTLVTP